MPSTSDKGLTLFVFEGAKTEDNFVRSLKQHFLDAGHTIECVYGAEIYQLYESIKEDGLFHDIVTLLQDRVDNKQVLESHPRNSFAEVYLFFDYDARATKADDDKIRKMLSVFDNETENGKLYISYPMVEALRHYTDRESFKELTVKCKRGKNCPFKNDCTEQETCLKEPHYKQIVTETSDPQLSNINKYTHSTWKELITAHLCKMNDLVHDAFDFPQDLCSQQAIFSKQKDKHIDQACPHVSVLSAFPIYVLDYYGCERLHEKLKE